ncbi:hypothetical protein BHE74_00022546, partial [Ensete ventricosum]
DGNAGGCNNQEEQAQPQHHHVPGHRRHQSDPGSKSAEMYTVRSEITRGSRLAVRCKISPTRKRTELRFTRLVFRVSWGGTRKRGHSRSLALSRQLSLLTTALLSLFLFTINLCFVVDFSALFFGLSRCLNLASLVNASTISISTSFRPTLPLFSSSFLISPSLLSWCCAPVLVRVLDLRCHKSYAKNLGLYSARRMHYNCSRSCRREEPQPAVAYGRDHVWTDPVRAEGKNSFALEISQNLSKKAREIPMKEAMDEEVSKEKDIRGPAPSLVARLMGLDTLPSSVREWKNMEDCCKAIPSKSTSVNFIPPSDRSQFRSTDEKQDFKDVFEVTETSKIKKHRNHTNSRKMLGCRGKEAGTNLMNQNFRDAKRLSTHDLLQNGKTFNDAFEVSDLSKDLFLELLQDPDSFLANHNVDLRHAPLSPQRSKITILKPSKASKHWSSEGWSEPLKSEGRPDGFFRMHQESAGSIKMKTASLDKHSTKENNVSLSCNLSASLHATRTRTFVHPARIVILKPNSEKAQKIAERDLFTHENSFISKKCREILASGIQELHDKDIQKFLFHTEVLSHKGSVEIAREITRKMRHVISSQTKKNFASQMDPYAKSGDSFIMPGIVKLNRSAAFYLLSDNFGEWSNSFSPSSSYSAESSASMEARKRLFERWKVTDKLENTKLCSRGSNTLGELLALSDRKTPKVTLDILDTKKVSDEKLTKDEILESKDYHLGISSMDGLKDGISGFLPRFNSLPASSIVYGSPKPSDMKQDGGSSNDTIKEVLHMGSSVASEAKCNKRGTAEVRSSKHHNHNSRLAHPVEEENTLPERGIHVNSEGLRKSIHVKNYLDNKALHPEPTDYAITIRKGSASIPIVGDDSRRLATQEEQVMQASFQVPSVQNDVVIEVIFWHYNYLVFFDSGNNHLRPKGSIQNLR